MKAVLISIRPKWCELIASGKKTVEVRKTKPKLETPFKCYIYCTNSGKGLIKGDKATTINYVAKNGGKVIGEFICDRVFQYATGNCVDGIDISDDDMIAMSCLTKDELHRYETSAEPKENCIYLVGLYGWHINDLVIYDRPKELNELGLNRPPQSWCYVEKGGEG